MEIRGSADTALPDLIQISPESSRPVSTLTRQAIDQFSPKFADFGTLANLLPSFVSSAPNGNAFDAAKSMTLRGFPDGQFNVTLDGIPFADPDGFGHHSTSIFPSSSIEQLTIDRSPGSGSALGHSGIGGTLAIASLAIPRSAAAEAYGAYGSFATSQVGALLHTAAPAEDGQTGLLLNAQHLQSNGAMANASGRRNDVLLKSESRFGRLNLTLLYSYDDYHFFNPPSVTSDELASGGSGVGLSRNPALPDYDQYAKTDRVTDIGYIRLLADAGHGSVLSETAYTYSYRNQGLSTNGDITLPKSYQVGSGFGVSSTDVAGRVTSTSYR
ncbi:MAG: TonB-dependent receptor plug domain-containing protein, partial [Rhizobacter sp.]|nr:TonB-dependent receptor plug domain-containing protein [Rhizobacter sp.]